MCVCVTLNFAREGFEVFYTDRYEEGEEEEGGGRSVHVVPSFLAAHQGCVAGALEGSVT